MMECDPTIRERKRANGRGDVNGGLRCQSNKFDYPPDRDDEMHVKADRSFSKRASRTVGSGRPILNEMLLEQAKRYMDEKGLTPHLRPNFMELGDRIYAIKPDGDAILLDYSLHWERDTGFANMIECLLKQMYAEQSTRTLFSLPLVQED